MSRRRAPVRRIRGGRFRLRLSPAEREVLRGLPAQLRELLEAGDPVLERLFPPAYPDDPEREAEYASLVRDDLVGSRLGALEVVEATIDAEDLSEDELTSWLSALNDLRLVLGTRLDVTEETYERGFPEDDPRAPAFALYQYLGYLEENVVAALAEGIPDG